MKTLRKTIFLKIFISVFLLFALQNVYAENTDFGATLQGDTLFFPKQQWRYSKAFEKELHAFITQNKNVQFVDMYAVNMPQRLMDGLFDGFPNLEFGFTLRFGKTEFKNNIRYYSAQHSSRSNRFREEYYSKLRLCKNLEMLDLGHNRIGNIDFIKNLGNLRVLILADNDITDISPLANLQKLEYVEMFRNRVADITPLQNMPYLKDINFAYNRISNWEALYTLPALERAWISHNAKQYSPKTLAEDLKAELNFTTYQPTGEGWREHPRYFEIINIFKQYNAQ